ncbi:MAG: DedA family protein [Ideonella sp.]|nr:DedA family protein [Ideonella sp.]
MFEFSSEAGLFGLFVAAFVSATILPGGAELVLVAQITQHPETLWLALAVASLGNTAGGAVSYVIGRVLPNKGKLNPKAMTWLHRWGYGALLFSWIPLFGDALCLAAGWLRLNPWFALPRGLAAPEPVVRVAAVRGRQGVPAGGGGRRLDLVPGRRAAGARLLTRVAPSRLFTAVDNRRTCRCDKPARSR